MKEDLFTDEQMKEFHDIITRDLSSHKGQIAFKQYERQMEYVQGKLKRQHEQDCSLSSSRS